MALSKGFKVTDAERKTRVGIAAKNYDELKKKTIDKFKLDMINAQINFQTSDGTLVETEDYFQTLPPQTLLIWVKKGERAETDAEILYKTIREVNDEYLTAGEKVQEFFTEKMKSKVFKLAEVLKGIDGDRAKFSSKKEHPEWFEGLDTLAQTKEDYMFRRAQDRVRTYYYKTREELMKNKDLPQEQLQTLLIELQNRLRLLKFHGYLFDRRSSVGDAKLRAICDDKGTFSCHGRWDRDRCLYNPVHKINPYTSREERIIFQTWNLDHKVERSRAVIPAICLALRQVGHCKNIDLINENDLLCIDVKRIYSDLFTTDNIKLVHIVCHDKSAHATEKAGPYLISASSKINIHH